jgi:hypothetical protein
MMKLSPQNGSLNWQERKSIYSSYNCCIELSKWRVLDRNDGQRKKKLFGRKSRRLRGQIVHSLLDVRSQ